MADISYTPAFHHTTWVDRVDRVEAAGPNGFNARFNTIESDLHNVSNVVTQISDELSDIGAPSQPPPPTGDQRVRFTPMLEPVTGLWTNDTFGEPSVTLTTDHPSHQAVMNIVLPDGIRLKTFAVRLEFANAPNHNILFFTGMKLSRIPLRLTVPPTVPDDLASAGFGGPQHEGTFDFSADINPSLGEVDQANFRYFLTANAGAPVTIGIVIKFRAVQLTYEFV